MTTSSPDKPSIRTEQTQTAVLMVDDQPANLLALEAVLEPLGLQLVKAHSGEEALKWLLREEFALILMDVQMPGLDGFRTASIVKQRERTRHVPIIFLTALSRDAEHIFHGYAQGAVDYLVKPLNPEILRSKVKVFVELYQKERQLQRQAEQLQRGELEAVERRAELRQRSLLDSMPQCVWASRSDGHVYYANRVWRAYLGLAEPDEAVGFLDAVHPDEAEEARTRWAECFAGWTPFEQQARLERQADGEYRWHMIRAVPEFDERGAPSGSISTATDVHDQKVAQEKLEESEAALRAASEAKDAFIAAASHELRTPLAAAKGHAHLALMRLGNDVSTQQGKAFSVILRQIDRMTRLVEDLLDVSRLQAGRLSLDREQFDFVTLLNETCERMQVISKDHELLVTGPSQLLVNADRGRLDQVATNLISNAIRYSPGGGKIRVGIEQVDDKLKVSVSDDGVGIPKDKQAVIFERFGSAHGAKYGGLGLGLTICQGIVEQHGGRIWFESSGQVNEGTTFYVELPVGEVHPVEASRATADVSKERKLRAVAGGPG